jgi:hypothetical protein
MSSILRSAGIDPELDELRASLEHLAALPSSVIERLLTESFDLASIDSMLITSSPPDGSRNAGGSARWAPARRLGSCGAPRPATQTQVPASFTPSVGHATTAAVLRSAWLSHGGAANSGNPFAVDLSSARVRAALDLLEGVRLASASCRTVRYQLERGLHENHPAVALDQYVAPLRERFPLWPISWRRRSRANRRKRRRRNVVDGGVDTSVGGRNLRPASPNIGGRFAAVRKLHRLRDTLDAVNDLGLAESVFHGP